MAVAILYNTNYIQSRFTIPIVHFLFYGLCNGELMQSRPSECFANLQWTLISVSPTRNDATQRKVSCWNMEHCCYCTTKLCLSAHQISTSTSTVQYAGVYQDVYHGRSPQSSYFPRNSRYWMSFPSYSTWPLFLISVFFPYGLPSLMPKFAGA